MPSQADLTVKANNGSTDVIYVAVQPSLGNRVTPALWWTLALGETPGTHPYYTHFSEANGNQTVRRSIGSYVYPVAVPTEAGSLIYDIASRVKVDLVVQAPQNVLSSVVNEAVAQSFNLFLATKAGYQGQTNYV